MHSLSFNFKHRNKRLLKLRLCFTNASRESENTFLEGLTNNFVVDWYDFMLISALTFYWGKKAGFAVCRNNHSISLVAERVALSRRMESAAV